MPSRIIFPRRGEVELATFDLPAPGARDVRLRTFYSLMSIGTETTMLHQRYAPDSHFAQRFAFPQLKTGVQAVGRVEQVGCEVKNLAPGDVVYLRLAHGSHQVLPAERCSPIPPGIDLKAACWAGLAKTAFRAAHAGPFTLGGEVLIIGAGPVGQMTLRWARAAGSATIIVVDLAATRLEHARRGGATTLLAGDVAGQAEEIRRLGNGHGPGLIVDTTGNAAVFAHALAVAAPFAKVLLLGDTGFPGRQCLSSEVMTKGLTIQAVHDSHDLGGWTQQRIDRLFFAALADGRFDVSGLITHEFAPRDCTAAYELAERQREQAMGILFDWSDEA